MIDTIGFKIAVSQDVLEKIKKKNYTILQHKTVKEAEIIRDYIMISSRLEYQHESWRSEIQYKLDYDKGYLYFLGFSLAKYMFGHNLNMLFDLKGSLEKFKTDYENYFDVLLPDIKFWKITRIDVCWNFDVGCYMLARYIMEYIKRLEFPRREAMIYKTSIHFSSRYYSFKIYLKYDEFLKHDFKKLKDYSMTKACELLYQSKGIIRVEASVRQRALKDYLQYKKYKETGIKEEYIFVDDITNGFLIGKLNEYIYRFLGGYKLMGDEFIDMLHKLESVYSIRKVRDLLGFYHNLNIYGKDEVKRIYGKSVYYRHKDDLKKAGVSRFVDDDISCYEQIKDLSFCITPNIFELEKQKSKEQLEQILNTNES